MLKDDRERLRRYANMSDFIWVKDNVLTSEFCKHCIERFESDPQTLPGHVGSGLRTGYQRHHGSNDYKQWGLARRR